MGLFDKIQSKIELYRLEQKYARRKNRSTFTTGAQYVDGEYVYTQNVQGARSPAMSTNSTGESGQSRQQNAWGSTRATTKRQSILRVPIERR